MYGGIKSQNFAKNTPDEKAGKWRINFLTTWMDTKGFCYGIFSLNYNTLMIIKPCSCYNIGLQHFSSFPSRINTIIAVNDWRGRVQVQRNKPALSLSSSFRANMVPGVCKLRGCGTVLLFTCELMMWMRGNNAFLLRCIIMNRHVNKHASATSTLPI